MGFDLRPRNKAAGEFNGNGFWWHWMLEAGVGLPLCHGRGIAPGSFAYVRRPDGLGVGYNDGARVTAEEAKQMAQLARWVADYQDTLHHCYENAPQADRDHWHAQRGISGLYNLPARRDFVEKTRTFADWAEKSGGFRVW